MGVRAWSAMLLWWAVGCSAAPASTACEPAGRACVAAHAGSPAASPVDAGPSSIDTGGADDDGGGAAPPQLDTRWILTDALLNARDLGGVPLGAKARTPHGALFRGPPLALDAQGCRAFAALGVRTVIDLRMADERAATPDAACALRGVEVVLAPLPTPYDVSATDYIADLDTADSIASAFGALGDADAYPLYFHCTWGRDRTGILGAVILLALGADREVVLQEYLLSAPLVGAYPASLEAALDEIERRGGVEAYLTSSGVSAEALRTLRSQLRQPAP